MVSRHRVRALIDRALALQPPDELVSDDARGCLEALLPTLEEGEERDFVTQVLRDGIPGWIAPAEEDG